MFKIPPIPDNVVFIDLETLPGDATMGMDLTQAPGWEAPPLVVEEPKARTRPRNLKDPAKIQIWHVGEAKRMEEAWLAAKAKAREDRGAERAKALKHWRDGSMDGYRARIACISIAFGEHPVQVIDCVDDEGAGLRELGAWAYRSIQWQRARNPGGFRGLRWVAHNGDGFDFPMIQLRAMGHGGLRLAGRFHKEKAWDTHLVDTLKWWPTMGGWGDRFKGTKLDDICGHLGIKRTDNPIDGSQVLDAYVRGEWPDVIAHAHADVRDLREVYRVLADVRNG